MKKKFASFRPKLASCFPPVSTACSDKLMLLVVAVYLTDRHERNLDPKSFFPATKLIRKALNLTK